MPIADLIFSVAISKVLSVIRKKLHAQGLIAVGALDKVPQNWRAMFATDNAPNHPLVDVSYVDDCAFPIYSKANTLCGRAASTMGVVQDAFTAETSLGLVEN